MKDYDNPESFLDEYYAEIETDPFVLYRSKITLIYYFITFFAAASIVVLLLQQVYMSIYKITPDMLLPSHPLYQETYNKIVYFSSATGNLLVYLISAIIILYLMSKPFLNDFRKLKDENFGSILKYIIVGYAFYWLANFIATMIIIIFKIDQEAGNEQGIIDILNSGTWNFVCMSIATVILAPILEEIVFRKCMFNLLSKKFKPILVIILSGFIFGSIHVISPIIEAISLVAAGDAKPNKILIEFIYLFVYSSMGIALGAAYQYSKRNIIPVIILHMFNNFMSVLMTISELG